MKPLLLAITVLISPLFAQEAPSGEIRGRIVQADNGTGIADAEVTLQTLGGPRSASATARSREHRPPLQSTNTGNDGRFEFRGVAPGTYTLAVKQDGFFVETPSGTTDTATVALTLAANTTLEEVSVALSRAGVIAGRVIDSSGHLLPRARIQAFTISYENGAPVLKPAAAKISTDRGEFRLFWLYPGEYLVQAVPPAEFSQHASLKAFHPNVTDLESAARVVVKAGDELTGVDIALPSAETRITARPGKISGQVFSTLPGTAMPAAATLLLLPHGKSDESVARVAGNSDSNTGRFEIGPFPAGSYDLYARVADPQGSPGRGGVVNAWGRALVEIRDGDVENLQLVVHPSVSVAGKISVMGTAKIASDIRVHLEPAGSAANLPNYQGVMDRAQIPNSDGLFTIPAVAEGKYRIQVQGFPPSAYVADVRQGTSSVLESGLDVGDKSPPMVEVMLGTDGAILRGTAAPAAIVVIVPAAPLRHRTTLYKSAKADAEGRFTINGIRPGEYTVFASAKLPEGAYQNADFVAKIEKHGKAVSLMPFSTALVDVSQPLVP